MSLRIERAAGLLALALWAVLAMTQSPDDETVNWSADDGAKHYGGGHG